MDRENINKILLNYYLNVIGGTIKNIDEMYTSEIRHYKRKRRLRIMKINDLYRQQLLLLTSGISHLTNARLSWELERTKSFWEYDCQVCSEEVFKKKFRMHRKTFQMLCGMLKGLQRKDTNLRKAIPLEKRIAVAVYALGSSAEYRSVGNLFGIGKSTVCEILLTFCHEAWSILMPLYLNHFPMTREKIEECVKGFETLGFPQTLGEIDGCHIEIHPHGADAVDYFNYKGWYSTVLLALVDSRYRFLYINVGSPGRCNDSQIFENSLLKKELTKCNILQEIIKPISGANVPVFIIGDSAFRFSKFLMKPYPFNVESNEMHRNFNYALSKSRRVVENAFGHLKARFRRIGKGIDNSIEHANLIIKACCALHNFLNENNDKINTKWVRAQRRVDATRQYPEQEATLNDQDCNAEQIREALASFISSRGTVDDGNGDENDGMGDDDGNGDGIGDADGNGDGIGDADDDASNGEDGDNGNNVGDNGDGP